MAAPPKRIKAITVITLIPANQNSTSAKLFGINALSTKSFAEVEFWFAGIKVITVIAFILLGGAAMFGFLQMEGGEPAPFLSNYTEHGGLFPHGIAAILITM